MTLTYRRRWSYAIAMKLPASAGLNGSLGGLALAVKNPIIDSKVSEIENLQRPGGGCACELWAVNE